MIKLQLRNVLVWWIEYKTDLRLSTDWGLRMQCPKTEISGERNLPWGYNNRNQEVFLILSKFSICFLHELVFVCMWFCDYLFQNDGNHVYIGFVGNCHNCQKQLQRFCKGHNVSSTTFHKIKYVLFNWSAEPPRPTNQAQTP